MSWSGGCYPPENNPVREKFERTRVDHSLPVTQRQAGKGSAVVIFDVSLTEVPDHTQYFEPKQNRSWSR